MLLLQVSNQFVLFMWWRYMHMQSRFYCNIVITTWYCYCTLIGCYMFIVHLLSSLVEPTKTTFYQLCYTYIHHGYRCFQIPIISKYIVVLMRVTLTTAVRNYFLLGLMLHFIVCEEADVTQRTRRNHSVSRDTNQSRRHSDVRCKIKAGESGAFWTMCII
jgi:hypothetical protein